MEPTEPAPFFDQTTCTIPLPPPPEDTPMAHMVRRLGELVQMRNELPSSYGYGRNDPSPSAAPLDEAIKAVAAVVVVMAQQKVGRAP